MTALLLALVLAAPAKVERDAYGVAKISATTFEEGMFLFGKTVAEDRLWQMENSRRVARGRSAELLGNNAVQADKDTLMTGYTDEEYRAMFDALPSRVQTAFTEYAKGVNDTIAERLKAGTLPEGYAQNGIQPEPWTVTDSMAIEVLLSRRFGTGGAGELRNLALYLYLKSQPVKDKVLDVLDDLAWQNDPASIPTALPTDDPLARTHPVFPNFTRAQTQAQLEAMPKVGLLELVPAIRAANGDDSRLIAEKVSAPFETGSYCVVVSPKRSAYGKALLMTAPQMGHSNPSIIHEIALEAPGLQVAGIDVPGIPAVVIGNTPNLSWGLTTGVADIADIVYATRLNDTTVSHGTVTRPLTKVTRSIGVKGRDAIKFDVLRTDDGPVIFESKANKVVFSQRMSYWKKEVQSWAGLFDLYNAKTRTDIDSAMDAIAMNMNFFFATTQGETGWRYLGWMPIRQSGFDPRFPMPSKPETDWQGYLKPEQMPHLIDTESGIIANWNNKPSSWWPNLDTPVWGSIFRNEVLLESLSKPKLTLFDLEKAAWDIARKETDSNSAFRSGFQTAANGSAAEATMDTFDGWVVQGAVGAALYREAVKELRRELFLKHTGNFTQDSLFERVVQPSVMMKALAGKTKYDFLAGRKAGDVYEAALTKAWSNLATKYGDEPAAWPTPIGVFTVPNGTQVPYSNRGTYIQLNTLTSPPTARSVASPGVTESGPHSEDQADLARAWLFKPVWRLGQ